MSAATDHHRFSTDTAGDIRVYADVLIQEFVFDAKASYEGKGTRETIRCIFPKPKIKIVCLIPSTGAPVVDLVEKEVSLHLGTSSADAHANEPNPASGSMERKLTMESE